MSGRTISFGPFCLFPEQRLLLDDDRQVRLGSRAFDILVLLVERAGEVVSKRELIARVWPKTFVEDANLKIQISALRRALGGGQGGNLYVTNVVGRGYSFVAPVRIEERSSASAASTIGPTALHNLPLATTRMIGREENAAALVSLLSEQRLITIVGPGGIGKTTVALAVAERMIGAYEQGVRFVDLAPVRDARLVPSAVGTVLGLEIRTDDPLPLLVAALRDSLILLVLDNCEHVIDAAADLAATILSGAAGVAILATSREPLGIASERVRRLEALGSPELSSDLTAAEAAAYPAVQLFVERATAIVEDFTLTDSNAPSVVAICRKLDGLPLAIEFAAPGVEVLGLDGLAAGLDESLTFPRSSRRGPAPRHRTMRAAIDWSYSLLGQEEQLFFRALSIFSGGFTVDAAAAVAMDSKASKIAAIDRLADLVRKSLVVADAGGVRPRFKLLETIRHCAIEILSETDEGQNVARRHAEYYRTLFECAEREAFTRAPDEWLADYGDEISNLRAALDWAFSPLGDGAIGRALCAAAAPFWMRLSLPEECRRRVQEALGTASIENPREELRLHAALGASTAEASEMLTALTKTLEMATRLGDVEYQLRALRGLYFYYTASGQFQVAHRFAREFHELALRGSDPSDLIFGERTMGLAEHLIGNQRNARSHLERVLVQDVLNPSRDGMRFRDVVRFGTDPRLSARVYLARVLWLQGFSDQAVRLAEQSLAEATAYGHIMSQCHALAMASCEIAFWAGDEEAAGRYTSMLVDLSRRHALPHWASYGYTFERILAIRESARRAGSPPNGYGEAADANFSFLALTPLTQLAKALGESGRITEGLAIIDTGIEQTEPSLYTPELFRLKGELSLLQGVSGAAELAERCFRNALDVSRKQGTLSWELRAATSLARLLCRHGRVAEAITCLHPTYDRFTEGFGTVDLIAAKQLLNDLGYHAKPAP